MIVTCYISDKLVQKGSSRVGIDWPAPVVDACTTVGRGALFSRDALSHNGLLFAQIGQANVRNMICLLTCVGKDFV